MEKCIGIKEVAEWLGISKATVAKLIQTGELVAARMLNKYIVKPSDVEKFLETHTVHKGE